MDTDRFATLSRALGAGISPWSVLSRVLATLGLSALPLSGQRGRNASGARGSSQRIWFLSLPRQGQRLLLGHLPGQEAEKGEKDTSKCVGHDQSTCQPGQMESVCGGTTVQCTTSTGDATGLCETTTGNAAYCVANARCWPCTKDTDCQPFCERTGEPVSLPRDSRRSLVVRMPVSIRGSRGPPRPPGCPPASDRYAPRALALWDVIMAGAGTLGSFAPDPRRPSHRVPGEKPGQLKAGGPVAHRKAGSPCLWCMAHTWRSRRSRPRCPSSSRTTPWRLRCSWCTGQSCHRRRFPSARAGTSIDHVRRTWTCPSRPFSASCPGRCPSSRRCPCRGRPCRR